MVQQGVILPIVVQGVILPIVVEGVILPIVVQGSAVSGSEATRHNLIYFPSVRHILPEKPMFFGAETLISKY